MSIILSNLIPQFLNEEIKLLYPKITGVHNINVDTESLTRIKYQFLLSIPFLYLSLVLSEKIIYNDKFNYLYNFLLQRHENIYSAPYISQLNIIVMIFKVIIVVFVMIIFFEFKDFIIDWLVKFVISKILKNDTYISLAGRYNKVFLKKESKRWEIDKSDYYNFITDSIPSSKIYERGVIEINGDTYNFQRVSVKTKKNIPKNTKVVSEDILLIDDTYYVKTSSEVYKKLSKQSSKVYGDKLLKKPDFNVLIFPITLALLTILGIWFSSNMTTCLRGEYVFANVKKGNIESVDESRKIQFKNNEFLINNQMYKVNNVTMQILDSNSEVVGVYNQQGGGVKIKDDSKEVSYYVLKSSSLYKNLTKK